MAFRGVNPSTVQLALNALPPDVRDTKRYTENIQIVHETLGKGVRNVCTVLALP